MHFCHLVESGGLVFEEDSWGIWLWKTKRCQAFWLEFAERSQAAGYWLFAKEKQWLKQHLKVPPCCSRFAILAHFFFNRQSLWPPKQHPLTAAFSHGVACAPWALSGAWEIPGLWGMQKLWRWGVKGMMVGHLTEPFSGCSQRYEVLTYSHFNMIFILILLGWYGMLYMNNSMFHHFLVSPGVHGISGLWNAVCQWHLAVYQVVMADSASLYDLSARDIDGEVAPLSFGGQRLIFHAFSWFLLWFFMGFDGFVIVCLGFCYVCLVFFCVIHCGFQSFQPSDASQHRWSAPSDLPGHGWRNLEAMWAWWSTWPPSEDSPNPIIKCWVVCRRNMLISLRLDCKEVPEHVRLFETLSEEFRSKNRL